MNTKEVSAAIICVPGVGEIQPGDTPDNRRATTPGDAGNGARHQREEQSCEKKESCDERCYW
jgi:hypothetical protein